MTPREALEAIQALLETPDGSFLEEGGAHLVVKTSRVRAILKAVDTEDSAS